jgi:hypothetical protein
MMPKRTKGVAKRSHFSRVVERRATFARIRAVDLFSFSNRTSCVLRFSNKRRVLLFVIGVFRIAINYSRGRSAGALTTTSVISLRGDTP